MIIHFAGQMTPADVRLALELHHRPEGVVTEALRAVFVLGVAAMLLYPGFAGHFDPPSLRWFFLVAFPPLYVVLLYTVFYPRLAPSVTASLTWRRLGLDSMIVGTASEIGFSATFRGSSITRSWGAYQQARISGSIVLLYPQKNAWTMFARSLFASDADWNAFVNLVKANVPLDLAARPARG